MAVTSRSALEFLRRSGLRETPRAPAPRYDPVTQKVGQIPLEKRQMNPNLLLDVQGNPTPDAGLTVEWPPPQEVRDESATEAE